MTQEAAVEKFVRLSGERYGVNFSPEVANCREAIKYLLNLRSILFRLFEDNPAAEICWLKNHGGIPITPDEIQKAYFAMVDWLN